MPYSPNMALYQASMANFIVDYLWQISGREQK